MTLPEWFDGVNWLNPYYGVGNNSSFQKIMNNTNAGATANGLVLQKNGTTVVEYGFNNSTNEAYIWAAGSGTIKFGTAGTKRMELLNSGTLNLTSNDLTTAGTVQTNNLSSFNSSAIQVLSPFNMQNNDVTGLPNPVTSTSAINKNYLEQRIDRYQTLSYSSVISWDAGSGNIAVLTLSGNCVINSISWNTQGSNELVLFVKQDSTGSRTLNIYGIYRAGSTSSQMPLSTAANAVDCLIFKVAGDSRLYLTQVINNFQYVPFPPTKYIFDYTGSTQSLVIPVSASNTCRIKLLGAGGGQGVYSANSGSSGAGGYTVFQFYTSSYIGQSLYIKVGQGGEGGISGTRAGNSGWPNGGWGISGDTYPGAGGGRSEVRIGSASGTILAIAGAGGGGSGYSTNNLGAGGGGDRAAGQDGGFTGSGGGTSSGGTSASSSPTQFQQAGFLQGAGATTTVTGNTYDCGGGGDGYYGGGCAGGDGRTSGGGSGYYNSSFSGPVTFLPPASSGMNISSEAASDSDFSGGYGIGRPGAASGTGLRGGQGRIVIEFV